MKIKNLVNRSFKTSEEKGFWNDYDSIIDKMKKNNFSKKEIESVKVSFVNQKLMLVVSELSELMETLRKDKKCECGVEILEELKIQFKENPEMFHMRFVHHVKDTFEDEIADVLIRLGDLIGKLNIDIETHIELKQNFNSLREKMHGKKF